MCSHIDPQNCTSKENKKKCGTNILGFTQLSYATKRNNQFTIHQPIENRGNIRHDINNMLK